MPDFIASRYAWLINRFHFWRTITWVVRAEARSSMPVLATTKALTSGERTEITR